MTKKGRRKQIERQQAHQTEERRRQERLVELQECEEQIRARLREYTRQVFELTSETSDYNNDNAQRARSMIRLYEAARRDQIIIETFGVERGIRLIHAQGEQGVRDPEIISTEGPSEVLQGSPMDYIRRLAHAETAIDLLGLLPDLSREEGREIARARSDYQVCVLLADAYWSLDWLTSAFPARRSFYR
ncbi:uncharacterized protein BJX67DRAFT_352078 [Aspergillus lucknowensis]|uniref:Uncharacterized protein n=1 Tax=Aspergillus lucknowensis TaxID=176173 RepID=A0ABR4LT12_9EURO